MKRGPKPRQVTQDLLEQIEHHVARGLSQKQICDALGFSETWWHAKKAEYSELGESYKKGSVSGLADVTNALYENAMSGFIYCSFSFIKKSNIFVSPCFITKNFSLEIPSFFKAARRRIGGSLTGSSVNINVPQ